MGGGGYDHGRHQDEDFQRAKERLEEIQQNAAGIVDLAAESNPGSDTWGMLGMKLFAPDAEEHLRETYEHLQEMSECLIDHIGALDDSRNFYNVEEQELADSLDALDDAIDSIEEN